MKKKYVEMLYGYLFVIPVIIGVLLFVIYPIFTGFYYSFTNYSPLDVSRNTVNANIQEEIEIQYNLDPSSTSLEEFTAGFDIVTFLDYGLLIDVSGVKKDILIRNFDYKLFYSDFAGNALNKTVNVADALKKYITKDSNKVFPSYKPGFKGFENYRKLLFKDDLFWLTIGNSFFYAIFVVLIQTLLAVILAISANGKKRGVAFFKTVFFIPSITSSAAICTIFMIIYNKSGVLNNVLGYFGVEPIEWLVNPDTALPAVMAMAIWTTAGYFMVTFLAGLQSIPAEMYESAEIDGANTLQCFTHITIPFLRPQIVYVVILGTIGCLQVFDQIYFLITNMKSATIAFYIYRTAFKYGDMGYASGMAVVLFVIIFTVTTLQRKFIKESVE